MAQGLQRINHLLFADDCMIFMKAELRQIAELKKLLEQFERFAGQRVNKDKSEIICSPNLEATMSTVMANLLGMKVVKAHTKYLGLPAIVSQNKMETFKEVEEKLGKKLHDWKNLTLSWAGKETLIKACLQALPIFSMSVFRLPKTMCERMNSFIIQFWWSGGKGERGIHWTKKDIVPKEKPLGGLGFRYMECLIEALLMKQLWRMLIAPDTLLSKVLRRKYFDRDGLLLARSQPTDSYV